ncbi:carbohydrate ABC transporter permease [Cohnella candidum]|uniref:Sugar ABC transporter permease n=1 Tax=Cohnella candidum TaxID=2674991 RepID=A0A3G3JZ67_9BACL|nr:sugar ABC transporter permease [Cohnella candidum]AYQ73483.1 sugar ABC transporter permease [Cohnella candidum]
MFKKNYRHDNLTAYSMLAPILVGLTIFVLIPFAYAIYLSFTDWGFYQAPVFVGFKNYWVNLTDPLFTKAIWTGLKFTLYVLPAQLVLAFLFANVLKGLKGKFSGFVKSSIYIPTVISGIVASVIFVFIYDYLGGLANYIAGLFGSEPIAWLAEVKYALPAIAIPAIWLGFGITTLIMLAGLLDISESYYEAADLEGAGTFTKMWYITLPLMKNISLFLLVTGFTAQLSQFELSWVMTGGGPVNETQTPNLYILLHFLNDVMIGRSIAAALMFFVVLGSISLVIFKILNSEKAVEG